MEEKIDIVLPWVDGNDPIWRAEKEKYQPKNIDLNSEDRYRDWDNLHFIFRGIEKFMPWVNNVFFITEGHLPNWLNKAHPKLKHIKHSDYLPKEYLPTYNSHTIELNLHRIKELNEKFIYFNDDFFILKPIKKEEFFKQGLPVDLPVLDITHEGIIKHIDVNNIDLINKHNNRHVDKKLTKKQIILKNFSKYFNLQNGKLNLNNLIHLYFKTFTGFKFNHHPQPYLKKTLKEVWKFEENLLNNISKNKFRTNEDVNQYLFRYWQLVNNKFSLANKKEFIDKRMFRVLRTLEDAKRISKDIASNKFKLYCINDGASKGRFTKKTISIGDFQSAKEIIKESLSSLLDKKSNYEK